MSCVLTARDLAVSARGPAGCAPVGVPCDLGLPLVLPETLSPRSALELIWRRKCGSWKRPKMETVGERGRVVVGFAPAGAT